MLARLRSAFVERLDALAEPAGSGRRALVLLAALAFLAVCLVPVPHRIDAPATIEATARRVVSAPFAGRLEASAVEPGDHVVAGQTVIATLETGELELELERVLAERRRLENDADAARVAGDPGRERIAGFAAERARAEAALLRSQLERAVLLAPISGVLLRADLRQRLGAPLERGEVLAEIAPLDELRAELAVGEGDLALVEREQAGELRTRSEPGTAVPLRIERIEPHPLPDDARGSFRVIASIDALPAGLEALPGMRGVAEVRVGRAPLLWVWLRPAVQALRLWSFR